MSKRARTCGTCFGRIPAGAKFCPTCGPRQRAHTPHSERIEKEPHRKDYAGASYHAARQESIEHHRGRCANCGTQIFRKENGVWKVLVAGAATHHKKKLADGGRSRAKDLRPLCRPCHKEADDKEGRS